MPQEEPPWWCLPLVLCDGVVLSPKGDKIVPGMVMAALRLNIPAIVCSGGPMLAGRVKGKKTSLSQMFEAVGAYKAGKLDDAGLLECEKGSCLSCGSCSGMFTANSMNCLCEALGLALHGNGTIPAPYSERLRFAKESRSWNWCAGILSRAIS